MFGKNGGDDETRTRDLCRDSWPFNCWHMQNQSVRRAVVGNRWAYRDTLARFCATICATTSLKWLWCFFPHPAEAWEDDALLCRQRIRREEIRPRLSSASATAELS